MKNSKKVSKTADQLKCFFAEDDNLYEKILGCPKEVRESIVDLCDKIDNLSKIGAALSAEHNIDRLLQMILEEAREFTHSDAGTLYLMDDEEKSLKFEIVQTDSLDIRMGGISGNPINWPPVRLYNEAGDPNHSQVSAHVGITGKVINIPDVYDAEGFDFSGTRAFDQQTGYRSKSMLVVPMRNHEDEIIGVLQIINATDPNTRETVPFSKSDERLIISLASQAAVAITNTRLIHSLEDLFESFIKVIASAIDEKSPYTGGHIERVALLTLMVAKTLGAVDYGRYASFSLNEDEMKELRIAAWLHDVGKITTPEYVVDKATKLETIYDRVRHVETRFELLKQIARTRLLQQQLMTGGKGKAESAGEATEEQLQEKLARLEEQFAFIKNVNTGGEFLGDEKKARIRDIAQLEYEDSLGKHPLLSDDEVKNLCISRGTLNDAERKVITNHVVVTIKMLRQLPYPKKLRRVPEFAGGHHEKLDGSGYPNGLTDEQLSPQAKIMALADIFEALTAKDRPYKKGKTLSEAMRIMGFMAKDKHIDPDIFHVFVKERVYLEYAKEFMDARQIDAVDAEALLAKLS